MRNLLITLCTLSVICAFAQEQVPEIKFGMGGTINISKRTFGGDLIISGQYNRIVSDIYYHEGVAIFGVGWLNRPNKMLSDQHVGILGGYDLFQDQTLTLGIMGGMCFGQANWRGEPLNESELRRFGDNNIDYRKAEYASDRYTYIGMPLALSFRVHFLKVVAFRLNFNYVIQPHADYGVTFGLMFGHFN